MNDKLIKKKIEKIFSELNIKYENGEFQDDDINYIITFNTYGKLKSLNSINAVLYLHHMDFSSNLLVPNVFSLRETDESLDTLDIYEVVNEINSDFPYGSFLVVDNTHIFYRSSINCGENYIGLNGLFLKRQLDTFAKGLEQLFMVIRSKELSDG